MRTINFILKESPIRKDILDVFDGEAFALRVHPNGIAIGSQIAFTLGDTPADEPKLQATGSRSVTITPEQLTAAEIAVGLTYYFNVWSVDGSTRRLLVAGRFRKQSAIVPVAGDLVAPSITTPASVTTFDGGASVSYTFVPPVVAGNPTPSVSRVLMVGGTNVTSAMSGNVYVATKGGSTQALVMTYTVSNGVGSDVVSTVSRTVPTLAAITNVGHFGQSTAAYSFQQGNAWDSPSLVKPTLTSYAVNLTYVGNRNSRDAGGEGDYEHFEVTQANLNLDRISASVGALSELLNHVMPGEKFSLWDLAEPGDNWEVYLRRDTNDGARLWSTFKGELDYGRGLFGELDILMTVAWSDLGLTGNPAASFMMGEYWDGSPATIGLDNLDHIIYDVTAPANEKGRGEFTRTDTKHAIAFRPENHGESVTHDADSRVQTFSAPRFRTPVASRPGGHAKNDAWYGGVLDLMGFLPVYMRAAGYPFTYPEIMWNEATVSEDRLIVDVPVTLPNGGTLNAMRAQIGLAAPATRGSPAVLSPDYQPIMGFEIQRAGEGTGERWNIIHPSNTAYPSKHRALATILDTGTGTGSARRGIVRLTFTDPIATGDHLNYLSGIGRWHNTDGWTGSDDRQNFGDIQLNALIEHIPAFYQAGATYPFPGIGVLEGGDTLGVNLVAGVTPQPLSFTTITTGTTAAIPADATTGDFLMAIADITGTTPPAATATTGWTTGQTTYASPSNGYSYRIAIATMAPGLAAPVFPNAANVEILRFSAGHTLGNVGIASAASGSTLVGPALTMIGTSAWEIFALRSRASGQGGWTSGAITGWTMFGNGGGGNKRTYGKIDPSATLPTISAPQATGATGNGSSCLHIAVVRP